MKILFLSNSEKYDYSICPRGIFAINHYLKEFGNELTELGKHDMLNFYRVYKKIKPDIIVTSWIPAGIVPIFFKKLGLIKTPIVHQWDDYYTEQMTNYPKSIIRFMENYCIKTSDYITTVSKYNEILAKKLGKKVFFIPHGIENRTIKTKINLNKLKTNPKNIKIIYIGEQSKYKKTDEIINAMKKISGDLFLVGKVNQEFKKISGKNIHFLGEVDPREIKSILIQGDILVNPSDQDSNFKFFEYISAKKPILGFDGRPNYFFKNRENALLTKDFEKGLLELANNKELRLKLIKNISKIKTFSWVEIAKKHQEVYEKILSQRKT